MRFNVDDKRSARSTLVVKYQMQQRFTGTIPGPWAVCRRFLDLAFTCSSFEVVVTIHSLAALDPGAGVEQPFNCLIIQNRQAVQSMRRSMDWTSEDHMVDGLFFCATLTGRRAGHTPFLQTAAVTSDSGAEAIRPGQRCSWQGHSRRVGAHVGVESTEFGSVVQPLRIPLVIRPERRTYVSVVR